MPEYIMICLILCGTLLCAQVPTVPTLGQIRTQQHTKIAQQNQRSIAQHTRNKKAANDDLLTEIREYRRQKIRFDFPDLSYINGTTDYHQAYKTIISMLDDQYPLSLQKAVFAVEKAYLKDNLEKSSFDKEIASSTKIILDALAQKGYEPKNTLAKSMLLHSFMSGTISVTDTTGKFLYNTQSKRYDFEDIYGDKDWTKKFVSKLIQTNSGQCHSLPLLYLILAENLGINNAHLSFSPEHSFIKIQDEKSQWHNLELTNGHFTTDTWLLSSGYVKSEALQNGIFLRPLSKKETIANCLIDLAQGYEKQYGRDSFVFKCAETALKYSPENIFALQMQADYYTHLLNFVAQQLGYPPPDQLPEKAYIIYQQCKKLHTRIHELSYEPMPSDIYKRWLKSIEENKHYISSKPPRA